MTPVPRYEVAPSGSYRAGGQELISHPDGGGWLPSTWTNFSGSFRFAVFADSDTGGLIQYLDMGRQTMTGGTVVLRGQEAKPDAPEERIDNVDDLIAALL